MKTDNISPPDYGIRIDAEGKWYYQGAEMFRKEIVQHFYHHLIYTKDGQYLIELENDRCLVLVEDCAFVVQSVYKKQNCEKTIYYGLLSDDSIELLNLSTLHLSEKNIPYCLVKNGGFKARFSRAAYYQLTETLDFEETTNRYFIESNNEKVYL